MPEKFEGGTLPQESTEGSKLEKFPREIIRRLRI
jgi:hypothetical protein